MNKTELLATLNSTFYHVGVFQQAATFGTLTRYTGQCFDQTGDIIRAVSVDFYVNNEGLPEEAAFWNVRQPTSQGQSTFGGLVNAFIAAKIADGTIFATVLNSLDENNERANATVYVNQAGSLNRKEAVLHRANPGGPITFTVVANV